LASTDPPVLGQKCRDARMTSATVLARNLPRLDEPRAYGGLMPDEDMPQRGGLIARGDGYARVFR
jgi:hypothetical protein